MKSNIKKSLLIMVFVFTLGLITTTGFSATLYLITSADTYDLNIGGDIDSARMQRWAAEIARHTGMQLRTEIYHGASHTQTNMVNAIQRLNPGPDDMVFFFYSGHGFRDAYSRSQFPSMRTAADRKGVELFWILRTLASKNPRFVLIMGDLCNNVVPAGAIQTIRSASSPALLRKNYIKLFREYRGRIIATSSKAGQYSFGGRPHGGLFINAFFNSFNAAMNTNNPTWDEILRNASRPLANGRQIPLYAINPQGIQQSTGSSNTVAQTEPETQRPERVERPQRQQRPQRQETTTYNYGSDESDSSSSLSGDLSPDSSVPAENYSTHNSSSQSGDLSSADYEVSQDEFNKGVKTVVTEEQDVYTYQSGLFTEINSSVWIQHTKDNVNAYYKVIQANPQRLLLERKLANGKIIRLSLPLSNGQTYLYTSDQGWKKYVDVRKQKGKVKFLIKREQNKRVVVNFNVTDIK